MEQGIKDVLGEQSLTKYLFKIIGGSHTLGLFSRFGVGKKNYFGSVIASNLNYSWSRRGKTYQRDRERERNFSMCSCATHWHEIWPLSCTYVNWNWAINTIKWNDSDSRVCLATLSAYVFVYVYVLLRLRPILLLLLSISPLHSNTYRHTHAHALKPQFFFPIILFTTLEKSNPRSSRIHSFSSGYKFNGFRIYWSIPPPKLSLIVQTTWHSDIPLGLYSNLPGRYTTEERKKKTLEGNPHSSPHGLYIGGTKDVSCRRLSLKEPPLLLGSTITVVALTTCENLHARTATQVLCYICVCVCLCGWVRMCEGISRDRNIRHKSKKKHVLLLPRIPPHSSIAAPVILYCYTTTLTTEQVQKGGKCWT